MVDEDRLELELSEPTEDVIAALGRVEGDIVVLGAGGKMGPSLVRLAIRASRAAGVARRVYAVSRFVEGDLGRSLEGAGAVVLSRDLLDPAAVADLPLVPNVVFMVGQKFGTDRDAGRTWALNTVVPGLVANRFRRSRIVVFSSGNVYPFWPVDSPGPSERDPVGPVGEYAQSVIARERVFEFFSARDRTPLAILRVNYAIEPRYGVVRDLADRITAALEIDLGMGWVNLIWQRDANAIALRALEHCALPPLVLNVTGRPAVSVRALATELGRRLDREPRFRGTEGSTALLSDPARCEELFGPAPVPVDRMIDQVAAWVEAGGPSLGRPTHFEQRAGRF
jgi:nucleoside-diphosphate-sugar epimerase